MRILTPRAALSICFVILATLAAPAMAESKPPAVGDEAKDFDLPALVGDPVKLSPLTDTGPVVLVVLRGYPGYQCPYCTKQFAEYLAKADALKASTVVFVYPGPADDLKKHAAEFLKDQKLPANFRLALDPDYAFTNAYGLRWDAKNETAYPSTFVIDNKRRITLAKVSNGHGDRTKVADVTAALGGK